MSDFIYKIIPGQPEYDMPCGFSKWEVYILNLQTELGQDVLEKIEKMLGVSIKVVMAHY